jgi:hypothetical protein
MGHRQFKKPADSNPVAEMAHEELEGALVLHRAGINKEADSSRLNW